jgi:IS4 transposase
VKHSNSIFHQLLKFIPRHTFQKVVDRYQGDYRTRSLSCWDQLVALLFAQLNNQTSLRGIETTFNSQRSKLYHLGANRISRSSLADANGNRPAAIYSETFYYLLGKVRSKLPKKDASQMVRLIDSTTIDLNFNQFKWAKFRSKKAGIKLHTVYDPNAAVPVFFSLTEAKTNDAKELNNLPMMPNTTYVVDRAYNNYSWFYSLDQDKSKFVGRMKTNTCYEVVETKAPVGIGVVADEIIRLSSAKGKRHCPIDLRRVTFVREEDQKELVFITNDLSRSAVEIAALYKQRWEIELFFKWIKQNLKIKRFISQNRNGVMIQVLIALISYLLLKLTQLTYLSKRTLYQICLLMGANLMERRSIMELLNPCSVRLKPDKSRVEQMHLELLDA